MQGKHEYTAQQNSLNVVRSKGGNIKIIITSANINSLFDNYGVPYWRYIPETNRNWTIAEYDGKTDSQIFSSNFDGGDCDVALLFLDGTFKIDYFENESEYYLKDTKVRILPVYEGNGCCVCDSSDSGFEVQITNTDTCITLIPEFDFLKRADTFMETKYFRAIP